MTRMGTLALAGAMTLGLGTQAGASTITFEATSQIVGQTSTNNSTLGGDPRYFATDPKYSGIVQLSMSYAGGSGALCSGALLSDRRSILTAAHCVSTGRGTVTPINTTVSFYNGSDPDKVPYFGGTGVTQLGVSAYFVNAGYTGEVIDQNDIAVLRLAGEVPVDAVGYGLFTDDLTAQTFNVTGYGRRSSVGGATGTSTGSNVSSGVRRQGYNTYDYQVGDAAFGGRLEALLRGTTRTAETSAVWLADFDNGTDINNGGCKLAGFYGVSGGRFCGTGLGANEVTTAPGDSGGASFIDGKISSVTSFGITFGTNYGDFLAGQNQSWGEFSGVVPVNIHESFIRNAMMAVVPEPQTWAMMVIGFGAVGGAMRRTRRRAIIATA